MTIQQYNKEDIVAFLYNSEKNNLRWWIYYQNGESITKKKEDIVAFLYNKEKNNYKQNGESITNKDIMNMLLHKNKFQ